MSNPRNPKSGLRENNPHEVLSKKFFEERKEMGSIDNQILEPIIFNLLNNAPSTQSLNLNFRTFNTDLEKNEKHALYYAISKNKSMKHLTLEALELDDEDAKDLTEALKNRKSETGEQLYLDYLSLRNNKFTASGTKILSTAPVNLISMKMTKLDDAAALSFVSAEAVIPKVEFNDNRLTAEGVRSLIENNKKTQILEWDWLSTALANPYVGDQSTILRADIENAKKIQANKKTIS